jgi:glycosyltransferase involved in cell wall biosynthesis
MSDAARVAVIVPCYNDGALVLEAVGSVRESEPVEIVVVDDASTDRATLRALERLRHEGIRVERHERNRGLPAARMTGVVATRAPYVFPLDADDLAVPGALTGMADLLDAMPTVAACFGDYAEFGTRTRVRRVPARLDPYRIAFRNDYPVSSLFRRSALGAVGGWQPVGDEVGYEDWNLWMALAERGLECVHWGRGVAFRRRLHGNRMLSDAAKVHVTLYRTLRSMHPRLFGQLPAHRRRTDLGPLARRLYPVAFGRRPPLSVRTRIERMLSLREGLKRSAARADT